MAFATVSQVVYDTNPLPKAQIPHLPPYLPVLAVLAALLVNSIGAAEPEVPPVITQDLLDVVVYEGNYFTLYVAATGSEPLTYNW